MKLVKFFSIFFCLVLFSNQIQAKVPSLLITEIVDKASTILSSSDPVESKIIKLYDIAETNVDIDGISMYTLGKYRKLISEDELILARAKFKGQIAHGSQTVSQRAERKAQLRGLRLGDDYDSESLKEIDLITSKDLQNTASRYLTEPLLSLCGPKEAIKKLEKAWNR